MVKLRAAEPSSSTPDQLDGNLVQTSDMDQENKSPFVHSRLNSVQENVVINIIRLDNARPRRAAENYLHLEHYAAPGR